MEMETLTELNTCKIASIQMLFDSKMLHIDVWIGQSLTASSSKMQIFNITWLQG